MNNINLDIFREEIATKPILENVTKYCTKCYSKLIPNSYIYFNTQKYEYICVDCAIKLSENIEFEEAEEESNLNSLF